MSRLDDISEGRNEAVRDLALKSRAYNYVVDYEDAARRYEAGETTVEIAKTYGVSATAIQAGLRRHGIALRKHWEVTPYPKSLQLNNDRRKNATHCKRGHPYGEDTIIRANGVRECRECARESTRRTRRREREAGIKREYWGISRKPEPCCRNCGSTEYLELHHAVPRRKALHARFDLRNGLPLCRRCHRGWHDHTVVIPRSVFKPDEWAFLSSLKLTGELIAPWLDERYPVAAYGLEYDRA